MTIWLKLTQLLNDACGLEFRDGIGKPVADSLGHLGALVGRGHELTEVSGAAKSTYASARRTTAG